MFAVMLLSLLWGLGIHGTNVVMGIIGPFLLMNSDQNRIAYQAGKALPNILTNEYLTFSAGAAFPICIACLLVAKAPQVRQVAKLGLLPAFFGIHEPLIFGLPIMFNPYLIIPLVVCQTVGSGVTYFVMKIGLIAKLNGTGVPWTTPPVLYGFLASGGHISAAVWQVILLTAYTLFSIPFVRAYDKTLKVDDEVGTGQIEEA